MQDKKDIDRISGLEFNFGDTAIQAIEGGFRKDDVIVIISGQVAAAIRTGGTIHALQQLGVGMAAIRESLQPGNLSSLISVTSKARELGISLTRDPDFERMEMRTGHLHDHAERIKQRMEQLERDYFSRGTADRDISRFSSDHWGSDHWERDIMRHRDQVKITDNKPVKSAGAKTQKLAAQSRIQKDRKADLLSRNPFVKPKR